MAVTRTILKINGTFIPDPSSLQWGLQAVSASDAGRDLQGKMHVNQVSEKRKLELQWSGVDFATAKEILQAVHHETFQVNYLDALTNTRQTRMFYVGDRTAPVYSYSDGHRWYTNVSFNIIEV